MLKTLKRFFIGSGPGIPTDEPSSRVPLPPIILVSADCPYCGMEIDPPPTRRRQCPHCAEVIYTHTNQETRKKTLLTAMDAERLERQQWDEKWQRLSAEIVEAYRTGDWHRAELAHFNQAEMLFDRGRDHRQSVRLSMLDRLRRYQTLAHIHSDEVVVRSNDCCDVCTSNEALTLTIAEALKQMPIPHDDCQSLREVNGFGGWCRCDYEQVFGN